MGHLYREKGNLRAAERWYRKAIEFNREAGGSWVFLGAVLAKQGRFSEAKRCHRRVVKMGAAEEDEAQLNLGLILRAEGDYEGALECFEHALQLDPNYNAAKRARRDVVAAIEMRKRSQSPSSKSRSKP